MPESKVLFYEDTQKFKCSNPECEARHALILTAQCHPSDGLTAVIDDGVITLMCFTCGAIITQFALARRGQMV